MKNKTMGKFLFALLSAVSVLTASAGELHFPCENRESMPADAHLLIVDQESFAPGVVGNALRVNGCENVSVPLPEGFGKAPLTVSGYFRPDHFRHYGMMTIASFFHAPREILAVKLEDGVLKAMDWSNYEKRRTIPIGGKLNVGEWHHLTWQMTGKEWKFFLDGKFLHSFQTEALPATAKSQKFLIGSDYNHMVADRHFWIGMLDEFEVRDGVLSPEECGFSAEKMAAAPKFDGLFMPGARHIAAEEAEVKVRIDPATQSFVVNGQKEPVMMYAGGGDLAASSYAYESFPDCRKSGITVFRLEITPRDFRQGEWWYGPDQYDFTEIDLMADYVLRQVPDAKILLMLSMSPPNWWGIANPAEETCDSTGFRTRDYHASHSFSSQKWIADIDKAMAAFFEHYKKTPYYKRTIGYVPVIGRYNESFRWGYNSGYKNLTDYSLPEKLNFQAYQKARYGTVEKRNLTRPAPEAVTAFEQAEIPTPEARLRSNGYFVDPVRDRDSVDYLYFLNDNHPDRIDEFTSIIRKHCGPDKVIGLYYGYLFSDSYGHGRTFSNESGHYGLGKALKLTNVDFMIDSMAHFQREMGNAGPTAGVSDAFQLHGKLWADEADIRTHLSGGVAEYSGAKNLPESLGILWRAFGTIQINRSGLWWFPIAGKNAYSDPAIWDAFGKMYREMEYTAAHPAAEDRANTVCFLMDPHAIHFRAYSKDDPVGGNLITGLLGPVAKAGFSYALHIVDDLDKVPDDYPVYVFLNSFHLAASQRALIQQRLAKKGKLLVWCYGAGYFDGEEDAPYTCSAENISALTGLKIKAANQPALLPSAGVTKPFSPIFYVEGRPAECWETFSGTTSAELDGKCAAALTELPSGAKSLYLGIPVWTPALLRRIAAAGGVHCYTQDTQPYVLRAGNGHLLLHSNGPRQANISLPGKARRVVDVMTGKVIAENTENLVVEIPDRSTRYLRIER